MRKLPLHSSLTAHTDKDLLLRMHSEDRNKYAGILFKRYAHLVYAICKKYLRNEANSKDVLMEVFEAFLKTPPAEDVLSFKQWLFTVAKHKSLTFLRNSKRSADQQEKWEIAEKKPVVFMENEEVRSLNSRIESENIVQNALKQLKEPQRICMQLFYMEGKSYKEIEKKTNYTLNQIKSYLQNGKRKLKILIERQ